MRSTPEYCTNRDSTRRSHSSAQEFLATDPSEYAVWQAEGMKPDGEASHFDPEIMSQTCLVELTISFSYLFAISDKQIEVKISPQEKS